jgi:MoxR-like ATPase
VRRQVVHHDVDGDLGRVAASVSSRNSVTTCPVTRGVDAETVDEAKVRGPLLLRTRDRAVTAAEYELQTRQAAPEIAQVRIADVVTSEPGAIRVLVIPRTISLAGTGHQLRYEQLKPKPDPLDKIACHLEERRVTGARVMIEMRSYQGVTVVARLRARPQASATNTERAAEEALYRYFHPLVGGPTATDGRSVDQFKRAQYTPCMTPEGHLLIDDIPRVGKTSLAKAIANSIDGTMNRIQFTPDLLPSDVTGTQIWNAQKHIFEYRPGPVFAHVVVGDEINRASPKTQSALLEVMEERQVTADATAYLVPRPFIVIATQNPVESDGTYHLPEAQIDRFMMRMSLGYPDHEAEVSVIQSRSSGRTVDEIRAVIDVKTAQAMVAVARDVFVAPALHSYIVSICPSTRKIPELRLGVSPRGSLALTVVAKAYAAAAGREFVTADDIKAMAPYALGHRMLLSSEAEPSGHTAVSLLKQITTAVPVPEDRAA